MKISQLIKVLSNIKDIEGDLDVELLETINGNTLPKNSYSVNVCTIDDFKFVDISDVWSEDK